MVLSGAKIGQKPLRGLCAVVEKIGCRGAWLVRGCIKYFSFWRCGCACNVGVVHPVVEALLAEDPKNDDVILL
eukprot:1148800-Pelagomonas_calceolata.AAC.7